MAHALELCLRQRLWGWCGGCGGSGVEFETAFFRGSQVRPAWVPPVSHSVGCSVSPSTVNEVSAHGPHGGPLLQPLRNTMSPADDQDADLLEDFLEYEG